MATAGFHRLIDPPRSRSSTKPQSGRSAGGHTPVDEGFSPIPICAIRHNRGEVRVEFSSVSHRKNAANLEFLPTSWKNLANLWVFKMKMNFIFSERSNFIIIIIEFLCQFFSSRKSVLIAKWDCAISLIKRIISYSYHLFLPPPFGCILALLFYFILYFLYFIYISYCQKSITYTHEYISFLWVILYIHWERNTCIDFHWMHAGNIKLNIEDNV